MYRVTIPPRKPWNKTRFSAKVVAAYTDFSEVMLNDEDSSNQNFHDNRMLAKGRPSKDGRFDRVESVEAANKLVAAALYNENGDVSDHVVEVYQSVLSNLSQNELDKGVKIYLPTIVREKRANDPEIPGVISKNALATVYTLELAKALTAVSKHRGETISFTSSPERRMLRLDSDVRLARREADIYQRFSRQNVYSASNFTDGEYVLITDDHVETGASLKSQIDTLENNGVRVVGIASFGSLTESLSLSPPIDEPYIAQILWYNKQITNDERQISDMKIELDKSLKLSGISLKSLTKRELLSLAGILIDSTKNGAIAFFDDLKQKFGVSPNVQEGGRNDLQQIMNTPALTTGDFYREMKINQIMEAIMSRQPHRSERVESGLVNEEEVKPFIFISAGGPAVGKSKMVSVLQDKKFFPEKTIFVGASMFEDCFSDEDFTRHFHPELLPEYFDIYKEAVNRLNEWAVNNGFSVVWEDHFQDTKWTQSLVARAKKQGYEAFAAGLFIDEDTHRKHRVDHGQIDESTPHSMEMMRLFSQNWDQLMSSGLFDHAKLFHRIKQANAPDWKTAMEERIILAAEYTLDDKTGEPICTLPELRTVKFFNAKGELTEREIDAYKEFQKWQKIEVNFNYMPGNWKDLFEEKDDNLGYFAGRVVDNRSEKTNAPNAVVTTRFSTAIQPQI